MLLQAAKLKYGPIKVLAVGITNQRETTVCWDRRTGCPLYNAIVWLDNRTGCVSVCLCVCRMSCCCIFYLL